MNTSCTIATLLVFLAILHGVSASALDDVCELLGGFYVSPELCRSVLCVDPACHTAPDVPSIKTMVAKLAVANATVVRDSVEVAARGPGAAEVLSGLETCLRLYNIVVPAMQWVERSVVARHYEGAEQVLSAAKEISYGCSKLTNDTIPKANDEFYFMAFVAFDVLHYRSS